VSWFPPPTPHPMPDRRAPRVPNGARSECLSVSSRHHDSMSRNWHLGFAFPDLAAGLFTSLFSLSPTSPKGDRIKSRSATLASVIAPATKRSLLGIPTTSPRLACCR
jgi:hypothetical protein